MFVQIIEGKVRDREAAHRLLERWRDELAPDTEGLLGATSGVTDDGRLVHVVRFRSQGDAGRHSDQTETRAWWDELGELLEEPAGHHDCTDVALVAGGGDDAAAVVQVVQKRSEPGQRLLHGSIAALERALEQHRPDVLGALLACAEDGMVTQVVYLSDLADVPSSDATPVGDEEATLLRQLSAEPGSDDRLLELRSPVLTSTGARGPGGA